MGIRSRSRLKVRKEKSSTGQLGFNSYMGYSGTQGYLSQFKNPKSSNSIRTYNPFQQVLDQTGADDF